MTLASDASPSAQDLFQSVARVLEQLRESEQGVDDALDVIMQTLGADRCALLVVEGDSEFVRYARHPDGPLPLHEWEEISRTVVRHARDKATLHVWEPFDALEADGSMAEIGILAAAATPITSRSSTIGVLYVDVRTPGKSIGPKHEQFLGIAASILAGALRSEQALDIARAQSSQLAPNVHIPLHELIAPASMESVATSVHAALGSHMNVLVRGPSGAGKTELAYAMANALGRDCVVRATLGSSNDLNTITSELFGHERGAFSGATKRRAGLVGHADGGVLILDEILNLPPPAQQLLLDFTQFGTYRPLGYDSPSPCTADVRIIGVTQGDLEAAVEEGRFRRDLYYRLAGLEIRLPALSERKNEIPTLGLSLLRRVDPARAWELAVGTRRLLARTTHAWPGNLRELQSLMERARHRALTRSADTVVVLPQDLDLDLGEVTTPPPAAHDSSDGKSIEERWQALEQERARALAKEAAILRQALVDSGGNVSKIARRLGVPRTTLIHRIEILAVDAKD